MSNDLLYSALMVSYLHYWIRHKNTTKSSKIDSGVNENVVINSFLPHISYDVIYLFKEMMQIAHILKV